MENLQVSDNEIDNLPKKGRGQYERKARGSYKNEKKITVKIFINSPSEYNPNYPDNFYYCVPYIQVSLKSQTTHFRATHEGGEPFEVDNKRKEIDFDDFGNIDFDKNKILKIIEFLRPFERNDFKVSEVSLICTSLYSPIYAVLIKAVAKSFNMISSQRDEKEIDKTSDWNLIDQMLETIERRDIGAYSKIDPEFWCIEEYCKLIERKILIQKHYNGNFTSIWGNPDLTLSGYLKGDFQKHFINELGQEKANKIFKSIDFILETYFSNKIEYIKYFINNL